MGIAKVLWISRHSPLPEEKDELINLLGPHTIYEVAGVSRDKDAIPNLLDEHRPDQVVAVLPLSLVEVLLTNMNQRGMNNPWRPVWQHRGYPNAETITPSNFKGYDEIVEMRYRKRRVYKHSLRKIPPTIEGEHDGYIPPNA
jgi:hypothetical protein